MHIGAYTHFHCKKHTLQKAISIYVETAQKEDIRTENNGILLLLVLLLVFASTGQNGISGGETWILILLALGLWSLSGVGLGLSTGCPNRGCSQIQ